MVTIRENKIKGRAIRMCLGEVYYFDSSGIYRKASVMKAKELGVRETDSGFCATNNGTGMPFRWMDSCVSGCPDIKIMGQAAREMCVGDSIDDLRRRIEQIMEQRGLT